MTTTPQADCFEHETWYKGPHGAPTDDLTGVNLAPFDPAWEQDHWESITVTGPTGSVTVDHPIAGFYAAPGGELLSWIACKGYDHSSTTSTTTTAVPATTTVTGASATTTPAVPPLPVPSSTIALDLTAGTTQPPVPPTLPATGVDSADAVGIAFGLLVAGGLAIWAARRRRVIPTVSEPSSNVTRVRPAAGPFDWEGTE